ncbi:alpha/beta hydrolase [Paraneptunicella aestuarii]|uniref:alpha/beta hydrolase n=1 Tax=Paraneptunicella aestuarii TaxID=2831148 RepID=UPI001E523335|nr:alpha/beta hydrolase-fold protein [Paraneptunicella aestuarii]UAA40023.1 alpha/beta hydrolase [Paraneptunicella aestuarii]
MKQLFLLIAIVVFSFTALAQNTPGKFNLNKAPFSIGESIKFDSQILQENRIVNVYLPASYSENTDRNYPVIYLLDGSRDEDFIHISGLVQFGSFSWINLMPESIVVGIGNVDRKRDFTFPSRNKQDKEEFPTSGGSARFIEFIEKELQPLVQTQYRVSESTTIVGQSLGGLLVTEILYRKPQLFDNYVIVSPSLWWDDESLLLEKLPEHLQASSFKGKVFIAVGKEGQIMERIARHLHVKLLKSLPQNEQLAFRLYEQQNHGDVLHLAAYDAFSFLFQVK